MTDRNGQATNFTYASGNVTRIVSTRSGSNSRAADVTYDGQGRLKKLTQTSDTTGSRSVTYGYTGGNLTSIQDAGGRTTTFGYTSTGGGDDLTSITNTGGVTTTISYDSAHRVTKVTRANPGGAAASTRFEYQSGSTSLVAGPNTNQSQSVSAVPHTTYTSDSNGLVTSAQDPLGRTRTTTYTPFADIASTTSAGGGVSSTEHNANGGESLTKVIAPMGATSGLSYTGSGAGQYLPGRVRSFV